MDEISFERCPELRGVTMVKESIDSPRVDLVGIVSSITSRHIQRIIIGFMSPITDAQLRFAVGSKTWQEFDETIARLAEQTLSNGRELQFEFHVCGDPSIGLFDLILPRFIESGCLKVVKSSYISKHLILHLPLLSGEITSFG